MEAPWRLDLRPSRSPCFWGHVGPLQAMLGPSWAYVRPYVGQFLGPFLREIGLGAAYVGPILSRVGLVGGHVGAILGLRETLY